MQVLAHFAASDLQFVCLRADGDKLIVVCGLGRRIAGACNIRMRPQTRLAKL
jgi:hypothetical protein